MRSVIIAIAILGLSAVTTKAADDPSQKDDKLSSIASKLPDTEDNLYHQYLFMLTKNGISLRMNGDQFCRAMHYSEAVKHWEPVKHTEVPKGLKCVDRVMDGESVKWCKSDKDGQIYIEPIKEGTYYKAVVFASRPNTIEDQVEVPGNLDWVFCRAQIKQ
jgi:hypothetical protein